MVVMAAEPVTSEVISIADQVDRLLGEALEIAIPPEENVTASGISPMSKYCGLIHAQLCRLRFLGFNNHECSQGVGISSGTLQTWLGKYPKLRSDMDRAEQLSKSRAAVRLQELMTENNMTGFNAVKFFLSTHSEPFREKQKLEVTDDRAALIRKIRQNIYGLSDDDSDPAVPLLEVDVKTEDDADQPPQGHRGEVGNDLLVKNNMEAVDQSIEKVGTQSAEVVEATSDCLPDRDFDFEP